MELAEIVTDILTSLKELPKNLSSFSFPLLKRVVERDTLSSFFPFLSFFFFPLRLLRIVGEGDWEFHDASFW